jgi:hypothetical protein
MRRTADCCSPYEVITGTRSSVELTHETSNSWLATRNPIDRGKLRETTLWDFLDQTGKYGGYAGVPNDNTLLNETLDDKVSIRFQTTFLSVGEEERATLEFATEAYNYNTMNDSDPKNLVVLATSQGIAVQQDGKGAKKLFHHVLDGNRKIHRHWLEAEKTNYAVGGPQNETAEDRSDAVTRGKATARMLGIPAMGKRFNVLMTIQVPLQQEERSYGQGGPFGMSMSMVPRRRMGMPRPPNRPDGEANAARVSIGSEVDIWPGLTVENPVRHPTQHATVTVVLYNTISGGVPSEADVKAAIDDMESLYDACDWRGRLAEKEAEFMKTQLTNDTLGGIAQKKTEQPYEPDEAMLLF